jgi:hypothetical protein
VAREDDRDEAASLLRSGRTVEAVIFRLRPRPPAQEFEETPS